MDWLSWLDKTKLDISKLKPMTPKEKKIQASIDNEKDSDNQYYHKEASWESWLEKHDGDRWDKPKDIALDTHLKEEKDRISALRTDKDIKEREGYERSNYDKTRKLTTSKPLSNNQIIEGTGKDVEMNHLNVGIAHENKSWESWLEKNNGIETDHKNDKKEEWDGKFSSSNTKDEVEDDDKAVSEEESLEELTDGKLEEVEKLKSWEIFLKAINATGGLVQNDREIPVAGEKKPAIHNSGSNLKTSDIATHGKGVEAKDSQRNAITGKLPTGRGTLGNSTTETPHKTTDRVGSTTATIGGGRLGGDSRGGGKKGEANITYSPSEVSATGDHKVTQLGTREVLQHEQDRQNAVADGWDPDTGLKREPPTKDQKDQNELTPINQAIKSWESWLNKYEETVEDKRLAVKLDEARAIASGKVSKPKIKPDAGVDAKMGEFSNIQAEKLRSTTVSPLDSWATWLEKMQGAGDARYGNQHLTGMEQHPVADDESMELSAETDENNEKQEENEDKDNKPYKALSKE